MIENDDVRLPVAGSNPFPATEQRPAAPSNGVQPGDWTFTFGTSSEPVDTPPEFDPYTQPTTAGTMQALPERFLRTCEVARILDVHENYVYERAASGELRSYKIGSMRRFRWSDVETWIEAQQEADYMSCTTPATGTAV